MERIAVRTAAVVSPQFDFCYALAEMLAPDSRRGEGWWFGRSRRPSWLEDAKALGWSFWLALPDAFGDRKPAATVAEFIESLEAVPPATFAKRVRAGLFHSDSDRPSPAKREWLHFIGLDDGREAAPDTDLIETLGPAIQGASIAVLRAFQFRFEQAWDPLEPELRRSARQVGQAAQAQGLAQLADGLGLAVEVDQPKGRLRALRGGYQLKIEDIDTVYFIPSAFNPRRFWTAADETLPATVYFPYPVPGLEAPGRGLPAGQAAKVDPWLVCKAIGDPTRAAILRRIAARPQPATELIAALGLSKATISHHIFQLREAGLIREERSGKSIVLSIELKPIDALGAALKAALSSR